jgi:hypothetical protein
VPLHAQRQCLHAAQNEEAVERAGDRADRVLQEAEPLAQRRQPIAAADDGDAADHVRVAVEVLRRRVDDDVEAELERPLHPRAGEGVVGGAEDAAGMADLGDGAQVGEAKQRIGRRLHPDQLRLRRQRRRKAHRIGQVDEAEAVPGARLPHALEQAKSAAVDVVARDDVRARVEQLEHGRDRRQARGEGVRLRAAFQVGDTALEREPGRVVRTAVVEALVHARALLHEGRGRVDRRHDRAGGRVGRLAGMDRAGGESVLAAGLSGCLLAHVTLLRR